MKPNSKSLPALADIEREVVAESREWGRQRLEERLQKLADQHGEVFPPKAMSKQKIHPAKRVRRRNAAR
jgi:biopolymer transport protein ExbB/TolQ